MRNILKSTLAAAVLSTAAFTLAPTAVSAGVMGLTGQESVAPASQTEKVWYCHRHFRHWGCSTCGVHYGCSTCGARVYGYAYPGYYGWGGGSAVLGAAATAATWPFWGWW